MPKPVERSTQFLKGMAELALLSLLDEGACYGLDILVRLRADAGLNLAEGALYPLLHRLEQSGLTVSEWRLVSDSPRPRKYYVLTDAGRAELVAQTAAWSRISTSLNAFLDRKNR